MGRGSVWLRNVENVALHVRLEKGDPLCVQWPFVTEEVKGSVFIFYSDDDNTKV
jgi:hypothetical protein